jgi:alpha-tubulin suppressor-like RCC1 family protein
VLDLVEIIEIASGSYHNLALDRTGTVLTWGANTNGQLGDGSHIDSSIPWPVTGLFSIEAIAAGSSHSLALRSDGTVWAWGANDSGQLGDVSFTESAVPVQVSGLADIIAIAAGENHSMALMLDGTVWTWENGAGQLGDGSLVSSNIPVQVTGLADVTAIAAGGEHSMVLKVDQAVMTWGGNSLGQLGDGTNADSATPVMVPGLADVKSIAAGSSHSMALNADNMVWTWGGNSLGQLGDSTAGSSTEPVQISGLTNISAIAAGVNHSMVLTGSIHFIEATAGLGGTITQEGETAVYDGGGLTLTLTPDTGFKVDDILVDDISMGAIAAYTFSSVIADHTISAVFSLLETDTDHDFIPDADDNCPFVVNPDQVDTDSDGEGDVCDTDDDNDSVADLVDNCPLVYNYDQANADGDSLGDACEQGPIGDDPLFDGNDDGVPDFEQANVESLPTYDDTSYVTFALDAGTGGAILDYVAGVDNPSPADAPTSSEFPLGFFDFQLSGMGIGGETTMGLYLPDNVLSVNSYYKYGPTPDNSTPHWYEFLYDGQTGAEINGNEIYLHFIDGMRGDDDLSENGVLVDVGGPDLSVNYVPDVSAISIILDPVSVNTVVSASADFTDGETEESHTATWDWGDGIIEDGAVVEADGVGTVTGSHLYTTPGVFTITLSVTDDFGNTGIKKHCYLVVFDPDGGFVTGGGWIHSPLGAFTADPYLAGKANFGFVSKYKKDSNILTGVTDFNFKVARFNFHSTSYAWLVVAGDKAQFKGEGTVNNEGTYGFLLSAIDGEVKDNPDTFRIKIWELETEHIVYDNILGDADDVDPTNEIGGGNIKVHDHE